MEPPKPKKSSSSYRFDDDTGYTFSGTPSLTVMLLISANKLMKGAIEHAKYYLPAIGTTFSGALARLATLSFLDTLHTSVLSLKLLELRVLQNTAWTICYVAWESEERSPQIH